MRRALRAVGLAAAAFVAAYAAFALYLHVKAPVLATDALGEFRGRLAAASAPEDVAWPRYRDALLALGLAADDPDARSAGAQAVGASPAPGDPEWADAERWLRGHRSGLDMLRDAARRPVFGFPAAREFDADDERLFGTGAAEAMRSLIASRGDHRAMPMLGILLPHLASMRSAGRMLAVDALLAAEEGDGERVVADIEAAMAMSIHVQDGRILIGDLVGVAIRMMARQQALEILERRPELLDGAQLERMQRAVTSVPPPLQRLDLGTERLLWADVLQRFYTDGGDGNGWFRLERATLMPFMAMMEGTGGGGAPRGGASVGTVLAMVSSPAAALLVGDRRETGEFLERWAGRCERASEAPVRERATLEALDAELMQELQAEPVRLFLPRLLFPAIARAAFAFAQDRAWATAAGTACAALRFRRDSGSWPVRAEDLVPRYLAAVPEDPWTGTPVRMASGADGFRIWSLGEDRTDEGGDPTASDGLDHGRSATTVCWRDDARRSGPAWRGPQDRVDWVWLATRGGGSRWRDGDTAGRD